MGRPIVKLVDASGKPWYLEWSTVVDAPVTNGMSLEDLHQHIQNEYGRQGILELPARLARVEATGTSSIGGTLDGLISCNRAGPNETELSLEELIAEYCVR